MSEINIILDILKAMLLAKPDSTFIKSLHDQFCNRGGLSKKQLEGLYNKASKTEGIAHGKLATLEAIIKKKATRYKSDAVVQKTAPKKDEAVITALNDILEKYPQHKRILFLQSKYNNNDPISPTEIAEIEKFKKLLLKS